MIDSDLLFPMVPPSHHNAPKGTSEVAARRIVKHAPKQRQRILDLIRERGAHGLADHEGEAELGIVAQSYTPRRGELVKLGLVADSGRRRKTGSGRPAAVWVAREFADAEQAEGGRP